MKSHGIFFGVCVLWRNFVKLRKKIITNYKLFIFSFTNVWLKFHFKFILFIFAHSKNRLLNGAFPDFSCKGKVAPIEFWVYVCVYAYCVCMIWSSSCNFDQTLLKFKEHVFFASGIVTEYFWKTRPTNFGFTLVRKLKYRVNLINNY